MDKILLFFLGNREPAHKDKLGTQLSLMARLLVGGYVFYLGYGLQDAVQTADSIGKTILFIGVIAVFSIAGGILVYMSLRDLIIGRYVGGKLDLDKEE